MSKHAALWIDHKEARIFLLQPDKIDEQLLLAPHHVHNKHPKGTEGGKNHPDDAKRFFHEVAQSLAGSEEILVVGPSTAKLEFLRHVSAHHAALEPKIVGVETVDHPTDGQLIAYAKAYFKRVDRML